MPFNQYIKVQCTDNSKWIDASVVDQTDGWITVLLNPGNIKLTLKKTKPGLYVGNMSGYEFVYKD